MAHSLIGRIHSSLGSVAEVSSIHPLSTLLLMRRMCAPVPTGFRLAGSLEQPGRRAGDRREEGRGGGEEQSLHSHGSLPVSSPESGDHPTVSPLPEISPAPHSFI